MPISRPAHKPADRDIDRAEEAAKGRRNGIIAMFDEV